MRFFRFLIVLLIAVVPAMASNICVSVYPLATIARQLVPSDFTVFHVVPPHADPHHFEPTPSVVRQIQQSDLFIGVDDHFDGWVAKFLPDGCETVYLRTHDDPDEHIWLGIQAARDTASRIHRKLASLYPDRKDEMDQQLAQFLAVMDETAQSIAEMNACRGTRIIQYHPAWDRFAAEMGITVAATLSTGHGHEVSARKLAGIITDAKKTGTTIVVLGLHKQSRIVNTLVSEINGTMVQLDTIGDPDDPQRDGFPELLLYNAQKLTEGCR